MPAMKLRRPDTVEWGINVVMARLGPKVAAAAINRSVSLLSRASNPDDDFKLGIDHIIALEAEYQTVTGEPGPLVPAIQSEVDRLAGDLASHTPADPLDRVTQVIKEGAEAVQAYRASHAASSPNMRTVALTEIAEAIDALQAMARDLEAQDRPANPLRAVPAVAE